jgi:hypothetical protein
LTVQSNFTTEDTLDHVLTHGPGVFTELADEQLMLQARDYILWRNKRIGISENVPVIGTEHRFSFGWDIHEVPILAELLQQITSRSPHLQTALEGSLGPNPALVELSTITAVEGAKDQHWHHDLNYLLSAPLLGRSFQHMYSLLIPLQDTVTTMGSTWVAPGSHYCANTFFADGFPVAGNDVWKAENGLLYHSAMVHRRGGHSLGPP